MRGNKTVRGGDPFRTLGQRKRDRKAKIARSPRAIRLNKVLGRVKNHKNQLQQKSHVTALMESMALRRQKQRAEEKRKRVEEEAEREAAHEEEQLQKEKTNHKTIAVTTSAKAPVATAPKKKDGKNNNEQKSKFNNKKEPKQLSKLQRQLQLQAQRKQ